MRQTARGTLIGFLLLAATRPIHAQSPTERAARAVLDSFFAAVKDQQWDAAVTHLDLKAFGVFLKEQVSNARSSIPTRDMTPEEYMATDTTMPRAVAEWEVARLNRLRRERRNDDFPYEFAGVTSRQALFALTVPQAAARWLAARDQRTQMLESARRGGCPLAILDMLPTLFARSILAVAVQNDSTTYAVARDERGWQRNVSNGR